LKKSKNILLTVIIKGYSHFFGKGIIIKEKRRKNMGNGMSSTTKQFDNMKKINVAKEVPRVNYQQMRDNVIKEVDGKYKRHVNDFISEVHKKGKHHNANKSIQSIGDLQQFFKVDNDLSEKLLEDTLLIMSKNADPDIGLKIHLNNNAIQERSVQTLALRNIILQIKESYRKQNINFWIYIIFILVLIASAYVLHNVVYVHSHTK
jgi:uncharacterized protein YaaR (DUF327 family)